MRHEFLGRQDIPVEAVMPAPAQQYAEIIVGTLIAVAVIWGMRNLAKRNDPRLLICMLAGFIAVPLESHAMGMMKFVYPPVGQHVLYTGFGRPVPIFMGLMYSAFYGVANYMYLNSELSSKWSAKTFWVGIVSLVAAEALLEFVSLDLGLWAYFDDQPFVILHFPIHVAIVVACMCMVFGAVSRLWFENVQGAKQWLMVLIGPATMLGLFTVYTYPVAFGIQSSGGVQATQIGSIITMIVALTIAYNATKFLSNLATTRRID